MSTTKSARVRARLDHPVVDADGHWIELRPIFLEYLAESAGSQTVDRYLASFNKNVGYANWYTMSPEERGRNRARRYAYWAYPATTEDRAASHLPGYFYDRMDEWGLDVALIYPTMGISLAKVTEDEQMRRALVRAYNVMVADMFKPYADRLLPAACVTLNTPGEAIEQLDHAHSLGLKLIMVNGAVPRTIEADAAWQPEPNKRRMYIDGIGLDSPYDYDPVWKKCVELKYAPSSHIGANIFSDRASTSNFVANHLGHLGQSHHLFARHLFLGGVSQRFPDLNFGFLEGGIGWACNLYLDLIGHWEKRNRKYMHGNSRPDNLDLDKMRQLFDKYCPERFLGKVDEILQRNLDWTEPDSTLDQLTQRDLGADDFAALHIEGPEDIRRLFARNFYFGCEADDHMTTVAFDKKLGATLKPLFGSDISHFDVKDTTEVLEESWEMVEKGLFTEENFREFTFTNAVKLHAGMNPDIFKGTVIEEAARRELAQTKEA